MNRVPIELAVERMTWLAGQAQLAHKFGLSSWGNRVQTHAADEPEDPHCGFSGCFMGWAIHQQWFEKFGLVMGFDGPEAPADHTSLSPMVLEASAPQFAFFAAQRPGRRTDATIAAVALLFGIARPTLEYIIYEEHYPMTVGDITVMVVRDRLLLLLLLGENAFMDQVVADEEKFSQQRAEDGP